jgi:hypothetical protein
VGCFFQLDCGQIPLPDIQNKFAISVPANLPHILSIYRPISRLIEALHQNNKTITPFRLTSIMPVAGNGH